MILSVLDFFNRFFLVYLNLKSDFTEIVHQDIPFQDESDVRRNFQEVKPVLLSDKEAFYSCESSVNKSSSLVESDSISTDDTLVFELNAISSLFVDFIANNDFTFIDKADFIKFV